MTVNTELVQEIKKILRELVIQSNLLSCTHGFYTNRTLLIRGVSGKQVPFRFTATAAQCCSSAYAYSFPWSIDFPQTP